MDRRDALRSIGLMGLGGLGLLSASAVTKEPRFNATYLGILARTVMDTERLAYFKLLGMSIILKGQMEVYRLAAVAVEKLGLAPFDVDFWKKAGEYIKAHLGSGIEAHVLDAWVSAKE